MELLVIISGTALFLLLVATSLVMIVFSDSPFAARLSRHRRTVEAAPQSQRRARAERALQQIGAFAGRGGLEGAERASLRAKLIRAGFYADRAAEAFFAIRVVGAVGLGLLAILALLVMRPLSPMLSLLLVLITTGAGLYLPNIVLRQRIKERTFALKIGLPDAVDLMVVCLEAGGTLSSAMQRVQSEFGDLHPVISEHFGVALAEMQAGSSRADALTRLAERAGSDEITGLMTMLVQSEALGASVAQTLRVFADQTRQARYLEAEKKAAELPVKLSIPLVLFIFPALMTVIFTPLIIRVFRTLLTV